MLDRVCVDLYVCVCVCVCVVTMSLSLSRIQQERKQLCHKSLENSRVVRERQAQLYAKLKPLSHSKPSPRTPGGRSRTAGSLSSDKSRSHRQAEANATRESIDAFEATLGQKTAPPTIGGELRPFSTGSLEEQSRQRNEVRIMCCGIEYIH